MHYLHIHVLLKLLEKRAKISSNVLSSMAEGAFVSFNHAGNISYLIYVLCWKGTSFRIY
jgi:hypothetical protein